jgi:hypothetical protein
MSVLSPILSGLEFGFGICDACGHRVSGIASNRLDSKRSFCKIQSVIQIVAPVNSQVVHCSLELEYLLPVNERMDAQEGAGWMYKDAWGFASSARFHDAGNPLPLKHTKRSCMFGHRWQLAPPATVQPDRGHGGTGVPMYHNPVMKL